MAYKNVAEVFVDGQWMDLLKQYLFGRWKLNDAYWKAHFGVSFSTLKLLWYYLAQKYNEDQPDYRLLPKYLIWCLYFFES